MAIDHIGEVAGLIWLRLSQHGEQSLAALKSSIEGPSDLIMAGVGWLAREDKLVIRKNGRTIFVSLR
jgi:hypothetical protein